MSDVTCDPFLLQPPTGTDTMVKSGVSTNISTKHQCITAMKEYESKSLEVSHPAVRDAALVWLLSSRAFSDREKDLLWSLIQV